MDYLGKKAAEEVREAIFRVIDYYDTNENVVFADATCGQVRVFFMLLLLINGILLSTMYYYIDFK